jgi:hypothetical protein
MTTRAFTLVVCAGCRTDTGFDLLGELRPLIRTCPRGMLVSAGCLLGPLSCAGRGPGAVVVLQPCAGDRTPRGPARWIGPIADHEDAATLRSWIAAGRWNLDALPARLRAPLSGPAALAQTN